MVLAERGTGAAIRCRRATPTAVAEPSAWNRCASDHPEFQHPQLFHQAWNRRTRPGHLLRAWIDDLGREHGRCFARAVPVHPCVESARQREHRIFCLVAGVYWLVPGKGLLGAILAMLIAAIVQLVASAAILAVGMREKINVRTETL